MLEFLFCYEFVLAERTKNGFEVCSRLHALA